MEKFEQKPIEIVPDGEPNKICPLIYDPCIGEDCICFDWAEYPYSGASENNVTLYRYCKHLCVYTGHEKEGGKK